MKRPKLIISVMVERLTKESKGEAEFLRDAFVEVEDERYQEVTEKLLSLLQSLNPEFDVFWHYPLPF